MREIEVIQPAHQTVGGIGELQDRHLSAGSEHTIHLPQPLVQPAEVTAAESASDAVEGVVLKRHLLGVGVHETHLQPLLRTFARTYLHHPVGEVDACHLLHLAAAQHGDNQVGCTDRHIQHMRCRSHPTDGLAPPYTVDVQRQHMVQTVVGSGYAVEECAYLLFFFHMQSVFLKSRAPENSRHVLPLVP